MNYQDLFYLTGTIATIIVSLVVMILLIKKVGRWRTYYKVDLNEWEQIFGSINLSSYRFDRIAKDIEHIRENLKIEKLKDKDE
jgi:hypothetical protein